MRLFVYLQDFPAESDQHKLGISKAVHGLASGTAAMGCETTVLCEGPREVERELAPNLRLHCFRVVRKWRLSTHVAPEFEQFIAKVASQSDDEVLFVLNGIFHPGTYAVAKLLTKYRLPYLVAPHDPYHPAIFQRKLLLKNLYWRLRERPMLKRAAGVQVLDARHGKWLARLGIDAPVVESINGYAVSDVIPETSLKWEQNKRPSVIFVGRIDAFNKGLDVLIEAVHRLPADMRPDLTIQGPDWGDRALLRRLVNKLGLTEIVHFPDADFDREASSLASRHDIFCLPSRFEGFGLAALEAMIAGRVILVSDVAGISPHVRASGCGVVVNSDPNSVRDGLLELLRLRPHWKEMGLAGRAYVLDRLQWEKIAADTLKEYRKVLKRSPGKQSLVGNLSTV